jgi:hypothetical protein
MSALSNPKLLEQLTAEYLTTRKSEIKTVKGPFGEEHLVGVDPYTLKTTSIEGGAGGAAGGQGGFSLLAPGVTALDPSKTGDEYLGQFSPEVQAAAKSYIRGDVMPTGNARNNGIANQAKIIAQTYGQQTGTPVSDALYSQRRKYRMELGSNTPSSAGGQGKAFSQALEHFASAADAAEALHNSGGLGITDIAHGINRLGAHSTAQADKINKMQGIIQQGAGEVGKLFSGSQGGGVHEREATRSRFSGVASPPELAGAFEGTLETLEGGLQALENRRDQNLGPGAGDDVKFLGPREQQKIDHIREVIARLRGQQGAAAPTPGGNRTQTGVPWSIVQ